MGVKAEVAENLTTVEVQEMARRQRLARALAERDILDEFLLDPENVARRFEVTLGEREIEAVLRAGRFVSEWDNRLGDGRWIGGVVDEVMRRPRAPVTLEEAIERAVRVRIAEEIVEDLPEAIRRAADRLGGEALVRTDPRDRGDIPASVRPLQRLVAEIADRVRRDLDREMDQLVLFEAVARQRMLATPAADRDALRPVGADRPEQPLQELRRRLNDVAIRAIADAVERTRPVRVRHRSPVDPERPRDWTAI